MITRTLHDSTAMACQSQAYQKQTLFVAQWDNNSQNEHYTVFSNELN